MERRHAYIRWYKSDLFPEDSVVAPDPIYRYEGAIDGYWCIIECTPYQKLHYEWLYDVDLRLVD